MKRNPLTHRTHTYTWPVVAALVAVIAGHPLLGAFILFVALVEGLT